MSIFVLLIHVVNLQMKVYKTLLAEGVSVAAVVVAMRYGVHTHERRTMIVGILCVIFGIIMYAAPLSVMVRFFHSINVFDLSEN